MEVTNVKINVIMTNVQNASRINAQGNQLPNKQNN
jgi:hypothetical protein